MRDRTVKSLSFKNNCPFESKLLKHALKYPNFAAYIKRLIQRDMEGGKDPDHIHHKKEEKNISTSDFS